MLCGLRTKKGNLGGSRRGSVHSPSLVLFSSQNGSDQYLVKVVAGLAATSKLSLWTLKCVEDGQSPEGNQTFLSVVMLASSKPSEELYARNSA